MKQLYYPQKPKYNLIHVGSAWKETIVAVSEELDDYRVIVTEDLKADLPTISGDPNQIFLAFLGILLGITDFIRSNGGGVLIVRCETIDRFARFWIFIDSHIGKPKKMCHRPRAGHLSIFLQALWGYP
jgi:hypothetical protein